MSRPVNPAPRRAYRSSLRQQRAELTRHRILDAAGRLFVSRGYAATTIAQIAIDAGVAVDTVYATIGPKPALFRLLLESAISGVDNAVPAEERDYVRRIRAATTAQEKLALYAAAVRRIGERMAPLNLVLQEAAVHSPELAEIRDEIADRRASNMRLFARDLAATGQLRPVQSLNELADVVWSMNSAEYFALLVVQRGWSPQRFQDWLTETWCRLFLEPAS